jgi:tripartite ATP-independent transporter DctM subunit
VITTITAEQPPGRAVVLTKLSEFANQGAEALYVTLTAGFAAVMGLGVFFRYVLNNSLSWSDELAMILFTWAILLGASIAYAQDRHVRLETLVRQLIPTWQARVSVLSEGLSGGFLLALLVSGIEAVGASAQVLTLAMRWPLTVPYLAIPVASALMLFTWVRHNTDFSAWSPTSTRFAIAIGLFTILYAPYGAYIHLSGPVLAAVLGTIFVGTLAVGMPIAFALGTVALFYASALGTSITFYLIALQVFYGTQSIVLLAVPLLILSGMLMHYAGLGRDIVAFAEMFVGRFRGGLGFADVVASLIFADISGSAISDTAAIGSVMIPAMKARGYHAPFTAALQGAAGTLGTMCPPAITLLLYGAALNVSITHLFAASVLPGVLVALSFGVVALIHGGLHNYPRELVSLRGLHLRVGRAVPGLFAGAIVLGGILGGVFTPAEAGTVLLLYIVLLCALYYRRPGPAQMYRATIHAGTISGMLLFLVATAGFLGWMLNYDQVSSALISAMASLTFNRWLVLALANLLLIVLGSVLEAAPIIFGFLPTFMPVLTHLGIDPVQWGVLFVIDMGIGMLIPPVALMLFISAQIAEVRVEQAMRAAIPFVLIMLLNLMLVAAMPELTHTLPRLLPR